jgi:small-conductance mechanosensitive channel
MSLDFLNLEFLDNRVTDYLMALAVLLIGIIGIKILQTIIIKRLRRWARKTASDLDDALLGLLERGAMPLLYLGTFYVAVSNLILHPALKQAIDALLLIAATIISVHLLVSLVENLLHLYWLTRKGTTNLKPIINALMPAIRTAAWAMGVVFVLDNLGFNVSAVLAGLGIGGVALALASQGILEDMFSYFAILLDRPFELGDLIVVGDFTGTIERVGIKTTRLESLSGEEIIMANKDLTSSRIRNFRRMERRRVVFKFGVTYETPLTELQAIPGIVKTIIDSVENALFDRAHFYDYGDFSLNFEVIYYVSGNDYKRYMDIQQEINLKLKQELERRGVEFAYPTQVTYLTTPNNGAMVHQIEGPLPAEN